MAKIGAFKKIKVLDPLNDLYEISHMRPLWPYENDSLYEIDSGPKEEEGGSKII